MAYERLKEQIKETPISMIIGQFIPLQKKGSNLQGLCPFHADTKPSLMVNDAKGMFKCFVCGEGGDAIKFVQQKENLDFVETLKRLSGILGIPFEEVQKERKKNPKLIMAERVLNASVKLYRKFAEQQPKAFSDFITKRKLNTKSIEDFQLGFAPSGNALLSYLQSIPEPDRKFAQDVAHEIGIIKYNPDRDSHYDFYRDRIMFPIMDHSGQVRGYSSRITREDQTPKYLNSGESYAFEKKSILFGFNFAKHHIRQRDQVLIVEGNMDVIMMHQFGFIQTVGTMGTALSEHSTRLLANMTKHIYLGMDSDAAGKKAMHRINADFLSLGVLPKLLTFEPAKDPDEFLVKEGQLALIERIEKAPVLLDVMIQEIIPEKISDNIDIKLEVMHKVFELVSPLKEDLSATERILGAAKQLGLRTDSETILKKYKTHLSNLKEKIHRPAERPKLEEEVLLVEETDHKAQDLHPTPQLTQRALSKTEKLIVREILCHPEFLTQIKKDEFLADIGHDEVKRLFTWLINIYSEIDDAEYVSIVQDELQQGNYAKELRDIGTDALFNHGIRYEDKVLLRMLKDYQLRLRKDQIRAKRRILEERQKKAQTQVEIDSILSEISKIDKEMMNLNL